MGRSDSKMLIAKIDARGKAEKEMLLFKVSTWEKYFGKLSIIRNENQGTLSEPKRATTDLSVKTF